MGMTRQLWSISALATELDLDRRTVAARIKDVPPAGTIKGHPAWRMLDVIGPLVGMKMPAPPPEPPEGFETLQGREGLEAGAAFMGVALTYGIARQAASFAIGAGATAAQAYALSRVMTPAMMMTVNEIMADLGGKEVGIDPEYIQPINWHSLAAATGEPVDTEAWQAHDRACWTSKTNA